MRNNDAIELLEELAMYARWLAISLLGICCVLRAEESGPDAWVDQFVVVIDADAKFETSDGLSRPARVGYRYRVGQEKEDWLWIVRKGGWIKRQQVVREDQAAQYFTESLLATPSAQSFYQRGVYWSVRNEFARAGSDFRGALLLEPDHVSAWIGKACVEMALGEFETAEESFQEALRRASDNIQALANRGNLWRCQGNLELAIADFSKAAELDPSAGIVFNNRGCCYLAGGDLQKALADFDQAIEIDPHNVDALNNRGMASQWLGDYEQAMADYQKAAQYGPECHQAYRNAAWLRATCAEETFRNGELAIRVATTACELTEYRHWYCLTSLAAAYAEQGNFAQAVDCQIRALGLLPAEVDAATLDEERQRLEGYFQHQPYRAREAAPVAFFPHPRF